MAALGDTSRSIKTEKPLLNYRLLKIDFKEEVLYRP